METETFVFRLRAYDIPTLLPQLSRAMEMRAEMRGREMYPVMWNYIDRIRAFGGGKGRGRGARIALRIVLLLVGIFLFVPGCMSPQTLRLPLIAGAVAIFVALRGLLRSGGKTGLSRRFERSARMLLDGKDKISEEQDLRVSFDAEGMSVSAAERAGSLITYERMESVVETADLYFLVYDQKAVVLPKRNLSDADPADFSEFLMAHKRAYYRVD